MKLDSLSNLLIYSVIAATIVATTAAIWYFAKDDPLAETTSLEFPSVSQSPSVSDDLAESDTLLTFKKHIREITKSIDIMQHQLNEQIQALNKQSQNYRHELSALKQQQDALWSQLVQGRGPAEIEIAEEENPDIQQEKNRALAEQAHQAQMNLLETYFKEQEMDERWSSQVESDFRSVFDNYFEHYTLHGVTCGDSMCRLEASLYEGDETAELHPPIDHLIHGDAGWAGQSLFELNTESGGVTVYLMRNGVDMPQVNTELNSN